MQCGRVGGRHLFSEQKVQPRFGDDAGLLRFYLQARCLASPVPLSSEERRGTGLFVHAGEWEGAFLRQATLSEFRKQGTTGVMLRS